MNDIFQRSNKSTLFTIRCLFFRSICYTYENKNNEKDSNLTTVLTSLFFHTLFDA